MNRSSQVGKSDPEFPFRGVQLLQALLYSVMVAQDKVN